MDNFEKAILVIAGIAIGAVVVFFITRPKVAPTGSYVVRSYSNNEEWEFTKDSEGRVLGVKVKRSAKEN